MKLHINASPSYGQCLSEADQALFGPSAIRKVRQFLEPLRFATTPLNRMDALARELNIEMQLIKDESSRSSLGSFKALGGAYAVIRVVLAEAERRLGRAVLVSELQSADVKAIANTLTVTCATDGNHGRSVSAGARLVGCKAVVYLHAGVSSARAQLLQEQGAEVVRVDGTYDDSVLEAAREATAAGWHVVSDTSWPGYERIPSWVMQGYLVLADEVLDQCKDYGRLPTHVFLQAGVGGFAAAIAAYMTLSVSDYRPRFIVVEPDRAACLFQSAVAQRRVKISPGIHTIMGMLECYEPSLIAWRILEKLAFAFITIDDAAALRTMKRLAHPKHHDPFVLSGESGGAGLAGLIEAAGSSQARELLALDSRSVALAFNTEGATDRALYDELLARPELETLSDRAKAQEGCNDG